MIKKHGGKREGSGRKPGQKNAIKRQLLKEILSDEEKKAILDKALALAKGGNEKLVIYFMDQIHGKAVTPIDMDIKNALAVEITDLTNKTFDKIRKET